MSVVGAEELVYTGIDSFNSLYVHNNTGNLIISCDNSFKIIIPTDNKHYEIVGNLSTDSDDKKEFDKIINDSGKPTHIYKIKDKEVFYYNYESDNYVVSFIVIDNLEFNTFEVEEIHYIPIEYYSLDGEKLEEI